MHASVIARCVSATVFLGAILSSTAARPQFAALGYLPGAGSLSQSGAMGVSADGSVVVGFSDSPQNRRAFRWTRTGGMVSIGTLGGPTSEAFGVSGNGQLVVGWSETPPASPYQACRWSSETGMVLVPLLPGAREGVAAGTSSDGAVVVGVSYPEAPAQRRAFRWTAPTGTIDLGSLNPEPWGNSEADSVSAAGDVIAGNSQLQDGWPRGFIWTATTGMTALDPLPGDVLCRAHDVSSDGGTVVGWSTSAAHLTRAVRWLGASPPVVLAGPPGATRVQATTVSGDGAVIGGYYVAATDGAARALIWLQGVPYDLAALLGAALPSGWSELSIADISADGSTIVGQGIGPTTGRSEAWLIDLLACPGDTNGDRLVDFSDLNVVLSDYGMSGAPGEFAGDLNADGVVNFGDLNIVLSNFGAHCLS